MKIPRTRASNGEELKKHIMMGRREYRLLQKLHRGPFFYDGSNDGGGEIAAWRTLKGGGFDIKRYRFIVGSRGGTFNNKKLGVPHDGFRIFYFEKDKFAALAMIFDEYPKLMEHNRGRGRGIIRGVIGRENLKYRAIWDARLKRSVWGKYIFFNNNYVKMKDFLAFFNGKKGGGNSYGKKEKEKRINERTKGMDEKTE